MTVSDLCGIRRAKLGSMLSVSTLMFCPNKSGGSTQLVSRLRDMDIRRRHSCRGLYCASSVSEFVTPLQMFSALNANNLQANLSSTHHRRQLTKVLSNQAPALRSLRDASDRLKNASLTALTMGTQIIRSPQWQELFVAADKRNNQRRLTWAGTIIKTTSNNDRVLLTATDYFIARCRVLLDAASETREHLQSALEVLDFMTSPRGLETDSSYSIQGVEVR